MARCIEDPAEGLAAEEVSSALGVREVGEERSEEDGVLRCAGSHVLSLLSMGVNVVRNNEGGGPPHTPRSRTPIRDRVRGRSRIAGIAGIARIGLFDARGGSCSVHSLERVPSPLRATGS